jgi:hypothetical protein
MTMTLRRKITAISARISHNPYVILSSGLILLGTATYEIIMTLDEAEIGVHHGVFIYAILNCFKALPEALTGIEEVEKAERMAEALNKRK